MGPVLGAGPSDCLCSATLHRTLGSEAGHVRHIGQIFFDEDLTQKVIAVEPYSTEVGVWAGRRASMEFR